mmetsp:Transcript_99526/g.281675  ORF Transcript_99526/g.281675 Transcript_99526/m.281675 type:complete len:230 (-) Transcript_99526:1105-1794(-)
MVAAELVAHRCRYVCLQLVRRHARVEFPQLDARAALAVALVDHVREVHPLLLRHGVARLQDEFVWLALAAHRRVQAEPRGLLPKVEDPLGQHPRALVVILEEVQVILEGPAFQLLLVILVGLGGTDVQAALPEVVELGEAQDLVGPWPEPALHRAKPVAPDVVGGDGIVQPRFGVVGVPPHVRHAGFLRGHDLPAAEPSAQRLVEILAAPSVHVLVVAADLVPPIPAEC